MKMTKLTIKAWEEILGILKEDNEELEIVFREDEKYTLCCEWETFETGYETWQNAKDRISEIEMNVKKLSDVRLELMEIYSGKFDPQESVERVLNIYYFLNGYRNYTWGNNELFIDDETGKWKYITIYESEYDMDLKTIQSITGEILKGIL